MGKQINERIFCMLNIILNSLGKIISFFLGELDGLLYALVIFVILDYITGVCVAIQTKKLSSNIGAIGIAKKVAIFSSSRLPALSMMMTVRRKMCCLRQGKYLDTAGHHSRINKKQRFFICQMKASAFLKMSARLVFPCPVGSKIF